MNELFSNSKDFVDNKQKEYKSSLEALYKRSVYTDIIEYVENEIIKNNLHDSKTTIITKYSSNENSETMSIETLIKSLSPSQNLGFNMEDYIPSIYNVLLIHFKNENQIAVEETGDTISLILKEDTEEVKEDTSYENEPIDLDMEK